jgi:hypothetical protein
MIHCLNFFSFKMFLVVACLCSLHWWGGVEDKNLNFCGFKYSCYGFCCKFEQGKEHVSPTITNPKLVDFQAKWTQLSCINYHSKLKQHNQPMMSNITWSFGANNMQ